MGPVGTPAADGSGLGVAGSFGGSANGASPTCDTATSVAAQVEEAFRERERLAGQMEALAGFLTADGMPGIRGPLVDEEGFPRADIDVHAVREARHQLACLQTDYRRVQRHLEELILRVHAENPRPHDVQQDPFPDKQPEANGLSGELEDTPPPLHEVEGPAFALVDVIHPESPSSAAGLLCGDRILRLGSLRLSSTQETTSSTGELGIRESRNENNRQSALMTVGELFRLLPAEVERHKDERMPLVVQRGSRVLSLWLKPRQWTGRGLLGCHLKPIPRE